MAVAVLHSASSAQHMGRIEFGSTRRARRGWAGTVTVEYDGELWAIDLDMINPYLADMLAFFDEIAEPDWSGRTRWESEFQELAIEAGAGADDQVNLAFSMWWSRGDELDNEREGKLVVRRGELPQFAARLRELATLHREDD